MSNHEMKGSPQLPAPIPVVWSKETIQAIEHPARRRMSSLRRDSTPFSNRNQRIRFNSLETRFTGAKPGPYIPNDPDSGKGIGSAIALPTIRKSILKPNTHEILIDNKFEANNSGEPKHSPEALTIFNGKTLTSEDALFCAHVTETTSAIFASAERHIRGALDILTFPTAAMSSEQNKVDTLGRIKGYCLIITEGLRKIIEVNEVCGIERMRLLLTDLEEMRAESKRAVKSAKNVSKFNRKVFKRWSALLRQKGVFKTDRKDLCKPPQFPLYSKAMPENVTLYEDVMDVGETYIGSFFIHWAPGRLAFRGEEEDDFIEFESCPMEVQFELILEVIWHVREMLRCTEQLMIIGLGNLRTPSLAEGYETVKTRILDMEFDSCFDPFCALELRAVLADLVFRKGHLLNIGEEGLTHLKWISDMIKKLTRYCRQMYAGTNGATRKRLRRVICCLPKYIQYEDVVYDLSSDSEICLDTLAPMTIKFQQIISLCLEELARQDITDNEIEESPSLTHQLR